MHAGGVHARAERQQVAGGTADGAHGADVCADSVGPLALLAAPHVHRILPGRGRQPSFQHCQLDRRRLHVHDHGCVYCNMYHGSDTSPDAVTFPCYLISTNFTATTRAGLAVLYQGHHHDHTQRTKCILVPKRVIVVQFLHSCFP